MNSDQLGPKLLLIAVIVGCSSPAPAPPPPQPATGAAALRDKVFKLHGHIVVMKNTVPFEEYRDVIKTAKQTAGVVSAEPFVFAEMIANSPAAAGPIEVAVKGVDPAGSTRMVIEPLMKQGAFDSLGRPEIPPTVLVADGLAKLLTAKVGDEITLTEQPLDPAWDTKARRPHVFRVGGIFHPDVEDYEQRLAYVSLAAHQDLLDRGDSVLGIEVRVSDFKQSASIAQQIGTALGGAPYLVEDWRVSNPGFVDAPP